MSTSSPSATSCACAASSVLPLRSGTATSSGPCSPRSAPSSRAACDVAAAGLVPITLSTGTVSLKSSPRVTAKPLARERLRGVVVAHVRRRRGSARARDRCSRSNVIAESRGAVCADRRIGVDHVVVRNGLVVRHRSTVTTNPSCSSRALRVVGRQAPDVGDLHRRWPARDDELHLGAVARERPARRTSARSPRPSGRRRRARRS